MIGDMSSPAVMESDPLSHDMTVVHSVQKFRFLPESYLAAVDTEWDTGLDQLLYLRLFIEEETGEDLQ